MNFFISLLWYSRTSVDGYFELVLEPFTKKNPIAADIMIVFRINSGDFFVLIRYVLCTH